MGSNGLGFVVAAYGITWLVVIGYFIRVHAALKRSREELDRAGSAR